MTPPVAPARSDRSRRRDGPARPAWSVPADDPPAARCPHCERPFRARRARDLHVGEVHGDAATADERAAYAAAVEAEADDLFLLHLKVVFALGAVYAALVVLAVIGFSVG